MTDKPDEDRVKRIEKGTNIVIKGATLEVGVPCNTDNGQWYCETHPEGFANNLEKDIHIHGGSEHVLVWVCKEHGPEVP